MTTHRANILLTITPRILGLPPSLVQKILTLFVPELLSHPAKAGRNRTLFVAQLVDRPLGRRILEMVKRHGVEILLKAGHPKTELARLAGLSLCSVKRISYCLGRARLQHQRSGR